jgi:hypothetical protein
MLHILSKKKDHLSHIDLSQNDLGEKGIRILSKWFIQERQLVEDITTNLDY